MADRLTHLLSRFHLQGQVLPPVGPGAAASQHGGDGAGRLHVVRRGPVLLSYAPRQRLRVDRPSAVLFARPLAHRLVAEDDGAEVLSAAIRFGGGDENPLWQGLPPVLVVPLEDLPALEATLRLLFDEALGSRCGRQAVVDRLTEVLVVQLLRVAIEQRRVDAGVLAGLADPRLAKALTAMHAEPGRHWTLEALAGVAGMSRARFAAHFAARVGMPPGSYLTQWRIGLAKSLLRRGQPAKQVAAEVGYGGASSLGRAFAQQVGAPPAAWVQSQAA
ncbi:MAG: AraC family transcriptional regulator [Piscinibacter sp.]|nr:AraC family transcriptional regulator [Piscinibacter sp.]